MADPRFFDLAGPFTLGELAAWGEATLVPPEASGRVIRAVGTLDGADAETLTFLDNKKYAAALPGTKAGAVVVHPDYADRVPEGCAALVTKTPYRGFALIAQRFHPKPAPRAGIGPGAVVDPSAILGEGVEIGANAIVEAGVEIGDRAIIGPGAVLHRGVRVGPDCRIHARVVLMACEIGARSEIHPGAVIGSRGFGFAMDARGHVELPQTGRVIVGEDVEIGSNSTIDRGMGPDTVIGDGVKIDNLVQIGHNVRIGRGAVLVAQSGVAGSTEIGDFAILAAKAGVAGHLKIGAGSQVAAMAGVMRDVEPGGRVAGFPAVALKRWMRMHAVLEKLATSQGKEDGKP